MHLGMSANKYVLAVQGLRCFLISPTSAAILKAVNEGSALGYTELHELTGSPKQSLYVFCQRLEAAKLIKRSKASPSDGKAFRTSIKRAGARIEFPALRIVR